MLSQKNVLQVFVSPLSGPKTTAATPLAALAVGEIGFFSVDTNETAASGKGYFGFNDGGEFKKSNVVENFVGWDVAGYAAALPHVETITVPAPTGANEYFSVSAYVITDNNNGDEVYKGFAKSIAGDTADTMAAKIAKSMNDGIARQSGSPDLVVTVATDTITITAAPLPYAVGKKAGGYSKFYSRLVHPETSAAMGTVTQAGTNGIGTGQYVHTKEFFYKQNHDAVSINNFRTALPRVMNSSPTGTYDVQGVNSKLVSTETSDSVKALPRQILIAFDTTGATPPAALAATEEAPVAEGPTLEPIDGPGVDAEE